MSDELKLTARFHQPFYQVMTVPQQAYLLLEIHPKNGENKPEPQPVNFCLVLDRSGSMAGEKLRYMKSAAKRIVDLMREEDILSIIVFDDTSDLIIGAAPVSDKEMIHRKIDAIMERGGTHMSTGMKVGLQELKRQVSPNRVNAMLLLTDGQTWEDRDECLSIADACKESGILIHVLGLGVGDASNWDPRLLEDLAVRSSGEWTLVEDPEQVTAVFEETLSTLKGTAVTNAFLTMRLSTGVVPRTVWRVNPLISRLGHNAVSEHDIQVHLGDIQYGIGQSILADILLPDRNAGTYRLIQADIQYDVPHANLTSQRVSIDIITEFNDDPSRVAQPEERVMNIIERVTAHRLQTQALDDAVMGDSQRATQRLKAAATRLLELGETDLAEQAQQQANQLEQGKQLSHEAAQKMRYATRKLSSKDLDNQ